MANQHLNLPERVSRDDGAIQHKGEAEPESVDNADAAASAQRERGGGGSPLPDRSSFEGAFGTDFSSVRVHRDGGAEQQDALAYAQGSDVHLAGGAPGPGSADGDALMGHELAHVVQQRQGRVAGPQEKGSPVVQDQGLEKEADDAGVHVARGEPVQAHLQGATGGGSSEVAQGKSADQPIQRHGAFEHKRMGDLGSDVASYRYDTAEEEKTGKPNSNVGFTLTHGDIVMISGDLFDARETDDAGAPIDDNLFKLANTPSNSPGEQLMSQDEILCALYVENPSDPRFKVDEVCYAPGAKVKQRGSMAHMDVEEQKKGAVDRSYDVPADQPKFPLKPDPSSKALNPKPYFSDKVKESVKFRYLRLAASNRDHFAAPDGAASKGAADGSFKSAGGSYRALHESAIQKAYNDGLNGRGTQDAMALEACAQHYLTDSFASGHLRTPTGSIKDHWDGIYPTFWENLKRFISHRVTVYINENETNAATLGGSVAVIEDVVNTTLEEITSKYPPIGFERLVADTTHDFDNVEGLQVTNDLGWTWTSYGDGMLKYAGKNDTETNAIKAVQLGIEDIKNAAQLPMMVMDPHATVRQMTPAPAKAADKYGAEQVMPRPDPARETSKQEGWKAPNLDELWKNKIRTDKADTYGSVLIESAKSGDIADQIDGMETEVPASKPVYKKGLYLGTVEPQKAFHHEVAVPIKTATQATLHKIIDLDVSSGHAFFNEDDAVMEEMDRMDGRDKDANKKDPSHDPKNAVKHMTLEQRAKFVKELMGGFWSAVWEDEEERILEIFETTPAGDRPKLYEMIEGHKWGGNYKEGFWVDDDELYNSLSGKELSRVRELINEGM